MSPTGEHRYLKNKQAPELPPRHQQKWVQHHIPAGKTEAPYEWRDVPIVEDEE
jgi:hypothetical protein